jgi:hypothetical protein
MEKRMNAGGLAGLEQVNLSARARRQVEHQISFAAMIVDMVIGKASPKSASNNASVSH